MSTPIPPISQSLLKSMRAYEKGEKCGLLIEAEWVRGVRFEPSTAMRLGQWFEYKATGQLNYYGEVPEPDRMKSGEPTKPFRLAEVQAEKFKAYMKEYKWEIKASGIKQVNEEHGMSMTLDVDLYIPKDGYWPFGGKIPWSEKNARVNMDLKYSGLIGNKWNPMGWVWETLGDSDHILQPIQYSIVSGRDLFLFMVFGTTESQDCKIFPISVEEWAKEDHLKEVKARRNQLKSAIRSGFAPHPSFYNCNACPMAEGCAHRVTAPKAEPVIRVM